jgi:hypothetical protein
VKTMVKVALTIILAAAAGGASGAAELAGIVPSARPAGPLLATPAAAWLVVGLGALNGVLMVLPIAILILVIGLCLWIFESDRHSVSRR